MDEYYTEYLDQIKDAVVNQSSLGRLSTWMEQKTYLGGSKFSFKNHEFQIDIVDSRHNNVVVIKPSQVGLTECSIRLVLSFLAVESGTVALHLLPTLGEAQKATKSRFDPIIKGSPYLRSIVSAGSDSSSFKQIGDSQLFTGGTYGKSVISIPTDLLSIDECDFGNPENIATSESRLTHSRFLDEETGARGLKRKWSTPTAVGIGVDALFAKSNQKRRLVRCKHCGHWFWPQFLKHVVVSGWDKPFTEMTHIDAAILNERGVLPTAKLLCEKCFKPITRDNLRHEYREWVAEFPTRTYQEGFHVNPLDLPDYHTPESILRKLMDYGNNTNHFYNFVLGLAYSDASNSIIDELVAKYINMHPITPEEAESGAISGCIAGLDVGRTSWLLIGKPNYYNKTIDIVWAESIRLQGDEDDYLKMVVLNRLNQYGVVKLVCDAMPCTPTILSIQAGRPEGWVLPNFYVLRDKKLPLFQVVEKEHIINSNRTKTLNLTAKRANSGVFRWPTLEIMGVVRKHLQGMKRIDREVDGEEVSEWVKSGEDHFFHAANYLSMANDTIEQDYGEWNGYRSSRLNRQYRVIYQTNMDEVFVQVEKITPDDYRRK